MTPRRQETARLRGPRRPRRGGAGRLLDRAATLAILVVFGLASKGCVDASGRVRVDEPSQTDFQPVADFLIHRCGSVDCHGQVGRNLILYGKEGLRLEPPDAGAGGATFLPGVGATQQDEYDSDYRSVVGLEPEIMTQVVAQNGAHPERLTFYRKPRGLEQHTGGTLIEAGDAQDTCLTSWLSGATDTTACAAALRVP